MDPRTIRAGDEASASRTNADAIPVSVVSCVMSPSPILNLVLRTVLARVCVPSVHVCVKQVGLVLHAMKPQLVHSVRLLQARNAMDMVYASKISVSVNQVRREHSVRLVVAPSVIQLKVYVCVINVTASPVSVVPIAPRFSHAPTSARDMVHASREYVHVNHSTRVIAVKSLMSRHWVRPVVKSIVPPNARVLVYVIKASVCACQDDLDRTVASCIILSVDPNHQLLCHCRARPLNRQSCLLVPHRLRPNVTRTVLVSTVCACVNQDSVVNSARNLEAAVHNA